MRKVGFEWEGGLFVAGVTVDACLETIIESTCGWLRNGTEIAPHHSVRNGGTETVQLSFRLTF